ncbi:MAG TPA: hypothetical protein VK656_01135 [Candidatus Acidoferrum sp.]|nr:hypothetical protein [Candidatus Acidoferrum sp.]
MSVVFEQPVTPIRRPRAPLPQLLALIVVVLLGVAVLKPWTGSEATVAVSPSGSVSAPASLVAAASAAPSRPPYSRLPAQPTPSAAVPPPSPDTIDLIVARFVKRAGSWGVGSGGSGPRMVRDDPWTDWAPVKPVSAGPIPDDLVVWPGTGICHDTPILFDRPSLVAITVPGGLQPDWLVVGWWTDGVATADLSDTIRQISPPGNRTITYLERDDGAPWPSGRYEFHVVSEGHQIALTVCIGKNGQA